jgi:signal transduction histidine kinase
MPAAPHPPPPRPAPPPRLPSALRSPLFRRYALLLSALVGTLLLLSGVVFTHLAHREALAAASAVQQGQARLLAAEITAVLGGLRSGLQAAAGKFELDGSGGAEALRIESAWLLRQHPALHALRWIGADGRERLVLSRYGLAAVDPAADWTRDPTWRAALGAGQAIGPTHWRDGSEPHVLVATAARPDGGGVLADVNLKVLSEVLARARPPQGGLTYVVDAGGALLAHPDLAQVLRRTDVAARPQVQRALARAGADDASGSGLGADGQPVLASSRRLDDLGWAVLVEQPEHTALVPARAALERSLALLAIGLLAAVAASAWLAWRLVRPIQALEAGAARLAAGPLDSPLVPTAPLARASGDELGRLAERFDAMAAQLQGLVASQEQRITERTAELARANEAKTRFLAVAAHDLRQPVHALGLFIGRLQGERLPARAAAVAADVARSARALDELVAALLDLSRMDVGALPVQPRALPLQALLDRLALQAEPIAGARGLRWRAVPTRAWVHSDPVLLERIALNLVSNALRYTARGGVLVGARPRGDAVELWVVDTGVGIAPAHLERVFDEFFRAAPPGAAGDAGLGMGLAIVDRLARRLGHPVALRSQPGRGTVASVRLPRATPAVRAAPAPEAPALPGVRLQGRCVLVVDDDAAVRDAMAGALARWGCHVLTAADGTEALALAGRERPDAVLCDLFLGGGECGLAVLAQLRDQRGAGLRCALVTAGGPEAQLAQAQASGHVLALKPLAPARLRALVESLLA